MDLVMKDVDLSVKTASSIPVSDELDRVTVTAEASKQISLVRSKQDLSDAAQSSTNEIQKSLNYRRSALMMMNSNYQKKLVRKVEPIYMNETRTLVTHY